MKTIHQNNGATKNLTFKDTEKFLDKNGDPFIDNWKLPNPAPSVPLPTLCEFFPNINSTQI